MMAIAAGGNAAGDAPAGGDAPAVPDPVSPVADWRPWPYVHVHFSKPESPLFPPEQTFLYEEPVEFGPVPRPTGCMGRIATLEKDLGTSKQVMGGAILKLVKRVKRLEKQANLRRQQPSVPTENVEPMEEQEEMEVPLTRKRSTYRRARTQSHTTSFARFRSTTSTGVPSPTVVPEPAASYGAPNTAGPSVPADKGNAPMPDLDIPVEFFAKDAQARKRLEEEQASKRLVQQLQDEDLAQEHLPNISEQRQKELDELMMRMIEADWLNLMIQVGSDPTLARELLGADVNEENFIPRMNAMKERKKRALADL
nr:hypothetical protein [Tanacetum cinerariifolium]